MKPAFDLTETRRLLRRMVDSGYLTVEQLDQPSPGWAENAKRFRIHYPNYVQNEYRNPLRDESEPEVQLSEPRDFTPTAGVTNAAAIDLPISLEEPDW